MIILVVSILLESYCILLILLFFLPLSCFALSQTSASPTKGSFFIGTLSRFTLCILFRFSFCLPGLCKYEVSSSNAFYAMNNPGKHFLKFTSPLLKILERPSGFVRGNVNTFCTKKSLQM